MSAITHLFAGVPVSDLDAGVDWYTRFFGRPPDSRVGDEVLWEIDEHAWLTLAVPGLDPLLERPPRENPGPGWERDRVRRAARRRKRVTSIGSVTSRRVLAGGLTPARRSAGRRP